MAASGEPKFAGTTLAILLLVPLHSYDVVMLVIPAIFIWSRAVPGLRSLLAGLLIWWRAPSSFRPCRRVGRGGLSRKSRMGHSRWLGGETQRAASRHAPDRSGAFPNNQRRS
jgi:hypothetical protein